MRSGSFWKSSETGRAEGPAAEDFYCSKGRRHNLHASAHTNTHTHFMIFKQANTFSMPYRILVGNKHNTQKDVSKEPHPGLAGRWPDMQTRTLKLPRVNTNK